MFRTNSSTVLWESSWGLLLWRQLSNAYIPDMLWSGGSPCPPHLCQWFIFTLSCAQHMSHEPFTARGMYSLLAQNICCYLQCLNAFSQTTFNLTRSMSFRNISNISWRTFHHVEYVSSIYSFVLTPQSQKINLLANPVVLLLGCANALKSFFCD